MLSDFTCIEFELCLGDRDPSRLSFEAKSLTENNEEHHSAITQHKILPQHHLEKSGVPSPHHYRVRTAGVGVIRHVRVKMVVWAVCPLWC